MCIVNLGLALKHFNKMEKKIKEQKKAGLSPANGNITFALHSADVCVYTCGHLTPVTLREKRNTALV